MKRLIGILILALTVVAGAQETLNNDSILKMVKAGLGEDLIVTMVQTQPGKYSVNPDELIRLKKAGVSERILAAMATKGSAANPPGPVASGPAKIAPGTSIRLAVDEAVSSSTAKAGDPLKVVAAEDLVINGRVVIAKGAPATGRIIMAKTMGRGKSRLTPCAPWMAKTWRWTDILRSGAGPFDSLTPGGTFSSRKDTPL